MANYSTTTSKITSDKGFNDLSFCGDDEEWQCGWPSTAAFKAQINIASYP
ncbi:MAG: hypothetical protein HKN05_06810 [Rhizobiales bacterium]|nr:hypothetical protein [Hyphomicrobiales bacterium]